MNLLCADTITVLFFDAARYSGLRIKNYRQKFDRLIVQRFHAVRQ